MNCRHCESPLSLSLVDLGSAPPSNAYLTEETLHAPEKWFPLRVLVCEQCWLVQTEDFAQINELFDAEYAYFSSFSDSWLAHSERYVADMVERFHLNTKSHVLEVAANDGYLLQYVKARNIPCTGIEPTASTAAAARAKGIQIFEDFFGVRLAEALAEQGLVADLTVANNVLAHVPDINDFVSGFAKILKPAGVSTFEFPHLFKLVDQHQFDTIYHEHFSYLSLTAVDRIFAHNGLTIFDVEEIFTHGGSLRVFAQRSDSGNQRRQLRVNELLRLEEQQGMRTRAYYADFQAKTNQTKNDFVRFLLDANRKGKTVAAYGAAAKGNTLINYAGIHFDLLPFVVDRNPAKQGKYMPGSRIPIFDVDKLKIYKPDFVVILPWNLSSEIIPQLAYVKHWGGELVTVMPNVQIA